MESGSADCRRGDADSVMDERLRLLKKQEQMVLLAVRTGDGRCAKYYRRRDGT